MSISPTYDKKRLRHVLRRRITTIIEEETIAENIREEPFEEALPKTVRYSPLVFSRPLPVSSECRDALVIDDLEERRELARITGLFEVPEKSDVAFEEIIGIFNNLAIEEKTDAVEWVKSLRRRR